jgi:hypothetical protein
MKAFISLALCASLVMGVVGCTKKIVYNKVPITTSSEEAHKEFLEGQSISEKLQAVNSLQHLPPRT